MAKKKKTQLKPVARGFATTSVPKKLVSSEAPETDNNADQTTELPIVSVSGEPLPTTSAAPSITNDDFDPEKVEEQSLQNLVDKLQEKTEKEITRAVKVRFTSFVDGPIILKVHNKVIEMERRFSKTLPRIELDAVLVNRILDLSSEEPEAKKILEEPEEKAIARLGVTYGILRRLGFTESRVEECLRAIQGVDLDEAIEWLHTHCTEAELGDTQGPELAAAPKTPKTPARKSSRAPATPRTPSEFLVSATPTPKPKDPARLDANAPKFVPAHLRPKITTSEDVNHATEQNLDSPSYPSDSHSSASVSLTSSPISDDPATQYAHARLELERLSSSHGHFGERATLQAQELQKRLTLLKNSYFFDEREAEAIYRTERDKAEAAELQARLRGNVTVSLNTPKGVKRRPPHLQRQSPNPVLNSEIDIFDTDGEDSTSGGVLDLLESMPETEVDTLGRTIKVRDMALPKHWSGRTPKTLLQETVAKADRYAAISYDIISGGSRAKRASLSIRWEGKKTDEWSMDDVACHDEPQAEQYIATIALHALTFPPTDGFAGVVPTPSSSTFFRLFPAVFRDLWDELESARKIRDDTINRKQWAMLRSVIEPKLEVTSKFNGRISKQTSDEEVPHFSRSPLAQGEVNSDQLEATFRARQGSKEYQEMLVSILYHAWGMKFDPGLQKQRSNLPIAAYREDIVTMLKDSQVMVLSVENLPKYPPSFLKNIFHEENHAESIAQSLDAFLPFPWLNVGMPDPDYAPNTDPSVYLGVSRELGDPPNAIGTLNSLVGYSIRLESNTTRNTRLAYVTNGIALRMLEGGTGQGGHGTAFDEITHIIIDEVHERSIESDFLLIVLKSLLTQRPDLRLGKVRVDWTEEFPTGDDDDDEAAPETVRLEKRYSSETAATINLYDERLIPYDLILRLLERICFEDPANVSFSAAILIFMPGLAEIRRLNDILTEHPSFGDSSLFKLFPLHSTLSSENQSAVFELPPEGVRKIVIATNIAETGITIPDITCVIDTGKHREMRFDEKRQMSRLVETFIARSNAAQRRGRAGRVQNGLCFHLFTKLRHDTQMADNPLPEMTRLSLSDLALRIKIMKVKLGSSIEDVLSRALDPPAPINVQRAVSMLVEVGALTSSEEITPMGRLLSKLPTDVHLGKFLLTATLFRCLDPALTIAAALNSKSPFVTPFGLEQEADRAKQTFKSVAPASYLANVVQNLQQIEELRQQFLGARYGRNKTRFVAVPPELDANSNSVPLINAALTAGLFPKILAIDSTNGQMRTISNNQHAAFHPSSVNFGKKALDFGVNHLSYFTLMHSKRLYAWETGPVDDMAILLLCGDCDFKLISDSAFIDRKVKFTLPPKSSIALKLLRNRLWAILAHQFRGKTLTETQVLWRDIAMLVLGKIKVSIEDT
ncbi:hypothetical protein H0H93_001352 [Arthromyces matolae]|nr:hypothetical protein H0H93_001352 [Arthromyces matolae]